MFYLICTVIAVATAGIFAVAYADERSRSEEYLIEIARLCQELGEMESICRKLRGTVETLKAAPRAEKDGAI